MASLFGGLLEKDNSAKKLQKEVAAMELKKQSLIASVQAEIAGAQRILDNELHAIGSAVYDAHVRQEECADDKLTAHYSVIAERKGFIEERESKIREIASRYDEEINMLNAHLGAIQPQTGFAPPFSREGAGGAQLFCDQCGKPYTPGEDAFCMSCGQKLE